MVATGILYFLYELVIFFFIMTFFSFYFFTVNNSFLFYSVVDVLLQTYCVNILNLKRANFLCLETSRSVFRFFFRIIFSLFKAVTFISLSKFLLM